MGSGLVLFIKKSFFTVSQLENKASNPIVSRIDVQLKEIAANLKSLAQQIETMEAPYHTYELKDQDCKYT